MQALWVVFIIPILAVDIPCPGGKHQCPDKATCCQIPDGSYGCCPEPNAVCCDDHVHCCPEGSRCDGGLCVQAHLNNSLSREVGKNVCPGGEYSCPDQSTCCINPQGKISGCCLMPEAICCSDGQHCCPKNSVCDVGHARCISSMYEMIMYPTKMQPTAVPQEDNMIHHEKPFKSQAKLLAHRFDSVICPGGVYQCPDGYTCCQLSAEIWGCCPYQDANCCADKQHCCPSGMKCDSTSQRCIQGHRNITWSDNLPAQLIH